MFKAAAHDRRHKSWHIKQLAEAEQRMRGERTSREWGEGRLPEGGQRADYMDYRAGTRPTAGEGCAAGADRECG